VVEARVVVVREAAEMAAVTAVTADGVIVVVVLRAGARVAVTAGAAVPACASDSAGSCAARLL